VSRVVIGAEVFESFTPESEAANTSQLFGEGRYYLDCKRRMGAKGRRFNIPDAFLIDLRRNDPRLFVVENELASHDLFKHIGVQLLQFSLSYRQAGRQLKQILFEEISKLPEVRNACDIYAQARGYRNLDYLLEYLIFDTPFQALVIIDEATDDLTEVRKQFSFPVEVIEFTLLRNQRDERAFLFTPFLQDVTESIDSQHADIGELDTIVVPAREEGFQRTFLGEHRWYAIRIHSSMIHQIKHVAAYRVAPLSAITHVAPVREIVPWGTSGKYCLEFAEPAHEVGPIKLPAAGGRKVPQAPRYTTYARLEKARTLADVF